LRNNSNDVSLAEGYASARLSPLSRVARISARLAPFSRIPCLHLRLVDFTLSKRPSLFSPLVPASLVLSHPLASALSCRLASPLRSPLASLLHGGAFHLPLQSVIYSNFKKTVSRISVPLLGPLQKASLLLSDPRTCPLSCRLACPLRSPLASLFPPELFTFLCKV
jgi:hypothetical protein